MRGTLTFLYLRLSLDLLTWYNLLAVLQSNLFTIHIHVCIFRSLPLTSLTFSIFYFWIPWSGWELNQTNFIYRQYIPLKKSHECVILLNWKYYMQRGNTMILLTKMTKHTWIQGRVTIRISYIYILFLFSPFVYPFFFLKKLYFSLNKESTVQWVAVHCQYIFQRSITVIN